MSALKEPWLSSYNILSHLSLADKPNRTHEIYRELLISKLMSFQEAQIVPSPKEGRDVAAKLFEMAETQRLRGPIDSHTCNIGFIEKQLKEMDIHHYIEINPSDASIRHFHVRGLLSLGHFSECEASLVEHCFNLKRDERTQLINLHLMRIRIYREVSSLLIPGIYNTARSGAIYYWFRRASLLRPDLKVKMPLSLRLHPLLAFFTTQKLS